jgi:hypothetical protein
MGDWYQDRLDITVGHILALEFDFLVIIFRINPGQPRTLLQLKLVEILTINLFLT